MEFVKRMFHNKVQLYYFVLCLLVKKSAAGRKEEQLEKKQELEKRLQDMTGVLGAAKKAKKGKAPIRTSNVESSFL